MRKYSKALLGVLMVPASISMFAGTAHAAVTPQSASIPSGIEVLNPNGTINGCYQTVGNQVWVKHCNFGLASQRFTVVELQKLGTGEFKAEITQAGHYLDIGPNNPGTVAVSTYSANSILYIHANQYGGDAVIERYTGRVPATNDNLGSRVTGGNGYNTEVGFNTFDGVQV
jgi:hypothetical protein